MRNAFTIKIGAGMRGDSVFLRVFVATLFLLFLNGATHAQSEAGFQQWIRDFWPTARSAGIKPELYNAAFAGAKLDLSIVRSASNQPEFVRPIWTYLDGAVSKQRVDMGRKMKRKHGALLRQLEQQYGVDQHILLAIWGLESAYGAILKNSKLIKPTIQSLATLGYADKRRSKYGREQLLAALRILQMGEVSPAAMEGSWAGAMGHTQFIPTTYLEKAVDHDGDGRRNVWQSIPDALASTANLLNSAKWESGKTWGYEVTLSGAFPYELADGKVTKSLAEWQKLGAKRVRGLAFPRPDDQARLFIPAGHRGPAFLMLKNFSVIKRYNNADSYALAIGHLADRIRGGSGFAGKWPRSDRMLTRSERKELQTILNRLGYDTGGVDGRLGSKSRRAIRHWQLKTGHVPDGFASGDLLDALRQGR